MNDDHPSDHRNRDDRRSDDVDRPREFPLSRRGTLATLFGVGGLGLLGGRAAAKPKGGKGNPPFVDVSDDETTVVEDVADINFAAGLSVTDDGDGTVSVDSEAAGGKWNDDDGDDLLEPNAGFLGIDLSGISGSKIVASMIETDGEDFTVEAGTTATGDAQNVVAGHASNEVGDGAVGATIGGGGRDDGSTVEPNRVFDDYGTVAGGRNNVAGSDDGDPTSPDTPTVCGGRNNTAEGFGAVVGGGVSNTASGPAAIVGTGLNNTANPGTVISGEENTASEPGSFVGRGEFNTASGVLSVVLTGSSNEASGQSAFVGSGSENTATEVHALVGTGSQNTASGPGAFVGTGNNNVASGQGAVVVDGGACTASGDGAFIGAGTQNEATGNGSFVGTGSGNVASGNGAVVVRGEQAEASGAGSFIGSSNSSTASGDAAAIVSGPEQTASGSAAFVGNGRQNTASATGTFVGNGDSNTASAPGAFVGAGTSHTASGPVAFIGTGSENVASGPGSFVGSGFSHTASGARSTVPGGRHNVAAGDESFAAGATAEAAADNSFVWNDGSSYHAIDGGNAQGLSSSGNVAGSGVTGPGTFHVSAQGGVRFVTGPSSVTYVPGGSAGWATTSTRAAKTNVDPIDPEAVLAGVEEMEVATWEYRGDDGEGDGTRRVGPMAEDFHEVVDVGDSDEHINSIDADGVALAAIQGLAERLEERDERIEDLEAENRQLRERLDSIEERLSS